MLWALLIFFCAGVIIGTCLTMIIIWFLLEAKHQKEDSRISVPLKPKFYGKRVITKRPKFSVLKGGKIGPSVSEEFRFVSTSQN